MKKSLFAAVCLAAVIAITACQPTPSDTAVVGKDERNLTDIIEQSNSGGTQAELTNLKYLKDMVIPQKWEETYDIYGRFDLIVDAAVRTGDIETCPVMKVEQKSFTPELAAKLVDYFTHDATGVRPGGITKEMLTEELIIAKRGAYNHETDKWESYDGQQEYIKELEKRIADMPDTPDYKPVGKNSVELPLLENYTFSDGRTIEISINDKMISVMPGNKVNVQHESWIKAEGGKPGEEKGERIDVDLSNDTAKLMGDKILKNLDIKGLGLAYMDKARMLKDTTIIWTGWMLHYACDNGGYIPIDPIEQGSPIGVNDLTEDFKPPWKSESLSIYLNEDGVAAFYWNNPTETVGVISDDTQIIPFEEVQKRIVNQIKYFFQTDQQASGTDQKFDLILHDVVLGNSLYRTKDDSNAAMSLPTWFAFITHKNDYEDPDNSSIPDMVTINAVDGSIINPAYY